MKRFVCVLIVLSVCIVSQIIGSPAALWQTAQAQSADAAYCIWDIDATQYPMVHLKLRVLDDDQQLAPNLNAPQIFENTVLAESVQAVQADGPLTVYFVVDGGRSIGKAQKEAMQRAISRFAGRVNFVDGLDAAQIQLLVGTASSSSSVPGLTWQDNKAAIESFASTDFFPKNTGKTKGLEALGDAVHDLKAKVGSPVQQAAVVVFITQRIEKVNVDFIIDANNWANLLKREHIPVYALHTDGSAVNTKIMEALVGGSARHVALTGSFDPLVDALYSSIAAHRKYYSVTFTSKLNTNDPRIVTFGNQSGRGVEACRGERHDTYTHVASDPKIGLEGLPRTLDFTANTPSNLVRVRLQWPPGVSVRKLTRAELLVDEVSKAEGKFSDDFQEVEFELRASNFGNKTKAVLQVSLTDGERRIKSPEQEVLIEQVLPAATAIPAPPVNTNENKSNTGLTIAATLGVLAVLGAAGGGGYYLWRRRKNPQNSGGFVRTNTPVLASQVSASLMVLEGPHGRKGEKIKLNKSSYVLGRQDADIIFYRDSETSTISRKHCTITRDTDLGFWITDNVSSNGTQIIRGGRNQPVLPNERSPLLSGDQILLGDLRRNGVLLQFTSDNPTQGLTAKR